MRVLATAAVLGLTLVTAPLSLRAFVAPQVGQPAPAFAVRDSSGQMVTLADYDDRVLVIEWLDPSCDAALAAYADGRLPALQAEAAERGVVWLTVLSARPGNDNHLDPAAVQAFATQHKLEVQGLLLDETATMARAYGVKQVPTFFLVGVDGRTAFFGGLGAAIDGGESAAGGLKALQEALTATLGNNAPATTATVIEGCELTL